MLRKTYFPFLIFNTSLFALSIIISLGTYFLFILVLLELFVLPFIWIVQLVLSACNWRGGKNDVFKTSSRDLIILIMSFLSIVPAVGFFADITGLVFCILNLVRYHKWKQDKKRMVLSEQIAQAHFSSEQA